jgi:hypothetical protein
VSYTVDIIEAAPNHLHVSESVNHFHVNEDVNHLHVNEDINRIIEIITAGPKGDAGAAGTNIHSGVTDPPLDAVGIDGDYYLWDGSGEGKFKIYGPKAGGIWPASPVYENGNRRHIHSQGTPLSVWSITHDLGGKPSVMVVDSADTVVVGDIEYVSDTEIQISFSGAFSGSAYLT